MTENRSDRTDVSCRFQSVSMRTRGACLDVEDGADVVARGQHKLLVQRPLGLVVQAGGRVQVHHLVVLHGQVVPRALQMRDLPRAPPPPLALPLVRVCKVQGSKQIQKHVCPCLQHTPALDELNFMGKDCRMHAVYYMLALASALVITAACLPTDTNFDFFPTLCPGKCDWAMPA